MTYHVDLIRPIFKKLNKLVPAELVGTAFTKEDITEILFCKLGWSASAIIEIFNELDKHGGFENIYGDGI
jgi:hypothetical protein